MKAIERKMNSNNPDTDLLHAEQICRHRHTQTHTQTCTHADTCSVALVDTEAWHLAPDTWHLALFTDICTAPCRGQIYRFTYRFTCIDLVGRRSNIIFSDSDMHMM